ncbi:MAG: hypothetical protein ACREHF_11765 [Rhizomicrobium sp.]
MMVIWAFSGWLTDHATAVSAVVSALATVFIAYFTITLARTSTEQGQLTQQSINLARAEFNATHRPKIIIHSVALPLDFSSGQDMKIGAFIVYANVGSISANITEIRARITRSAIPLQAGVHVHELKEAGGKEVVAGGKDYFRVKSDHTIAPERAIQESNDPSRGAVICMGVIVYEDGNQNRRETGFYRRFDAISERWERGTESDSAEYEYSY